MEKHRTAARISYPEAGSFHGGAAAANGRIPRSGEVLLSGGPSTPGYYFATLPTQSPTYRTAGLFAHVPSSLKFSFLHTPLSARSKQLEKRPARSWKRTGIFGKCSQGPEDLEGSPGLFTWPDELLPGGEECGGEAARACSFQAHGLTRASASPSLWTGRSLKEQTRGPSESSGNGPGLWVNILGPNSGSGFRAGRQANSHLSRK